MSDLDPKVLYERYCNKEIDKTALINSLLLLIEESPHEILRIDAIDRLRRSRVKSNQIFNLMENLTVSDGNKGVRNAAARYISFLYFEKSYEIVNWAIQFEESYDCILTMISTLKEMKSDESKSLLISEISKSLQARKELTDKPYLFQKYRKRMKKVLKNTSIERFSVNELAELLINYKTIAFLALSYPNFYFDLDISTGLVSDVDLADYLQFEVKGTPFGWKNNIESISDIKGLANLKHIRTLDLSNNLIEELIGLSGFKNLETIILANNKISDPKNVQYLNALPKLRYIDLSGNKIVNSITRQDFVHGPKVILKRFDARFEI